MFDQLLSLLRQNADPQAVDWLDAFLDRQKSAFDQRQLYYAFSGATRRFPKSPVPAAELSEAPPGFTIEGWTLDRLARSVLLQVLAQQDRETFLASLNAMAETADLRESAAIFATFPLLPHPEQLVPMAREGLRTNVVDIFDAIALQNPFPAAHFDEEGWNQMVLKAFFLARPTYKIVGLEDRANANLARASSNYAHERWAAGRPISPELWRSCQNFVDETIAADVLRVAESDEPGQAEAAALVAANSGSDALAAVREKLEKLVKQAEAGDLTWKSLGQRLEAG